MSSRQCLGALALALLGCTPAVPPLPKPQPPGPIRLRTASSYAPEQVEALIREQVEAALPGRHLTQIRLLPWAGDADRFSFEGRAEEPALDGWSLRAQALGEVDMHTRRVTLVRLAPVADAGPGAIRWNASDVQVIEPTPKHP